MSHYTGKIRVRVAQSGDVDLIGDDGKTYIASVGVGLHGEGRQQARGDAQRLVNAWNALHDAEKDA